MEGPRVPRATARRRAHSTRSVDSTRLDRSTFDRTALPRYHATTVAGIPASLREVDLLRAAFRDVHGARLHGFALLVSLGDRARAGAAAGAALGEGIRRARELRHPERAAAQLRHLVLESLRSDASGRGAPPPDERRHVLHGLGVDETAFDGLAALAPLERAALVASAVEGFDPIDLETILGSSPADAHRTVARARRRYLAAVLAAARAQPDHPVAAGALTARIDRLAAHTIGAAERSDR
jgi:hypothetical protein